MNTIQKTHWIADQNNVRLNMPFTKVNAEARTVSGFATLDNVDTEGDVVLAEASQKAFARFRGNIREMHQPIAAGHLIDFRDEEYYDAEAQKFYNGVYVTAYVSKGAQSTWEKVLDGTLTGFSIMGNILDSESEWMKDASRTVRFVKDYDLYELSLVDNPANQLANVFSFAKSADGLILKGMLADVEVVNVFWCDEHKIAKKSADDTIICDVCETEMQNIGWYEGGEDAATKVADVIHKYLTPEFNEGGVEMSEETTEETAVDTDTDTPSEDTAADLNESDFAKMFDDLKGAVETNLEKTKTAMSEAVVILEKKVTDATELTKSIAAELETKIDELDGKLTGLREDSDKVAKALKELATGSSMKKSVDVEDEVETETEEESFWGGKLFASSL